jgi:septum formation protein
MRMKRLPLILASASPYRFELMSRLQLPFTSQKPAFDEDSRKGELSHLSPAELAKTLAEAKALSLSTKDNCVIGSDQLLSFENQVLGKSGNVENAIKQLKMLQGREHQLITATCVVFAGQKDSFMNVAKMKMRALSDDQIRKYIKADQPIDCAGSYKIEKSGIALFEQIDCSDFTAIQGLPLMALSSILIKHGYSILGDS